jgi:predicted RNase H-like HicB family nuclease
MIWFWNYFGENFMVNFTLEYWLDDDWYVGKLRELPNCFSQGATLQELEENIKDVYSMLLEDEMPLPVNAKTKMLQLAA